MNKLTLALYLISVLTTALHAERPNVILVMADDQGWGDTGYNGHPAMKTPNLDAMAKDSLVFNRFYAAAPVCSPTRGSVLTGRHPIRIKITNHGRYMRPQETTIAEALRDAGYVTGMFGKWHVGSAQKDSPVNPGNSGFDEWVIGLNFFDNDPFLTRNGIVEQIKGSGSEITVLDHAFGRLRNELRILGIERNTIRWYCSDNGGLRKESSGGRERKGSIYEGGLRVPAIFDFGTSTTTGDWILFCRTVGRGR